MSESTHHFHLYMLSEPLMYRFPKDEVPGSVVTVTFMNSPPLTGRLVRLYGSILVLSVDGRQVAVNLATVQTIIPRDHT